MERLPRVKFPLGFSTHEAALALQDAPQILMSVAARDFAFARVVATSPRCRVVESAEPVWDSGRVDRER